MKRYFGVLFVCFLTCSVLLSNTPLSSSYFENLNHYIDEQVKSNQITGLSIAITDGMTILWSEAYGMRDTVRSEPVTTQTLFSIQSMSKTLTATAVMFAVQEGLVDLDEPITTYLPHFRVHSKYEKHPERMITLRLLLSHRAGFTHEAPEGNNFERDFTSFKDHIKSISDTWLKAPVGTTYSYSNLGIDLAGYIIQVVSGIPFAEYVESRVFFPLRMTNSSFDWQNIKHAKNRAKGYNSKEPDLPLEFAMIPAGGCYTNVEDMANFMMFHMNKGTFMGKQLLDPNLLDQMYTVPCSAPVGYALGIEVRDREGSKQYYHSGGGYGFQSHMEWFPGYQLGIVILTNSANHDNLHKVISKHIIESVTGLNLDEPGNPDLSMPYPDTITLSDAAYNHFSGTYLMKDGSQSFSVLKKDHLFGADAGFFFIPFHFFSKDRDLFVTGFGPEMDGYYTLREDRISGDPGGLFNQQDEMILCYNGKANDTPGPDKPYWKKYTGTYQRKIYNRVIATHTIKISNGYLYLDDFRLSEFKRGIFYLPNGEVLNIRTAIPTFRNIDLIKVED